jgi:hypothetical protein
LPQRRNQAQLDVLSVPTPLSALLETVRGNTALWQAPVHDRPYFLDIKKQARLYVPSLFIIEDL